MKEWEAWLEGWTLEKVRPVRPRLEQDPHRLLEDAVGASGLTPFLRQASSEGAMVTVLLNDRDRFTDSRTALDVMLRVAEQNRIMPRFRVLFATGSHTFTEKQKREHEQSTLPEPALESWERSWHEARDREGVHPVGSVHLHHWVVESGFVLVVGSMEPHYFAGVTGAHKTLSVGVMSYESLRENHYHALSAAARGLELDGNPVYEAIAAEVEGLQAEGKRIFAINEVLVDKRIVSCTAGDPLDSLKRGLPTVRRIFSRRLPRRVDFAVARVAPPLDKSLYQADKGIKNVENAVRDGGVILLEAACHEGVGIDRFMRLMERAPSHEKALELVHAEGYRLGDHKAVRLRALTQRRGIRLGIVSPNLSEREAEIAGLERFDDLHKAARWALSLLGNEGRAAALVEDAGNMMLTL